MSNQSPYASAFASVPETDPTYLAFAAGQGFREAEASAYTALKQNAIHQAFEDSIPGLVLQAQQKALDTTKTYGDAGAWRTGARVQAQARDAANFQSELTMRNNAQQSGQNDLAAQLAAHIADLRIDTTQAGLQARNNSALSQAALGQQAFVNGQTTTASAPGYTGLNPNVIAGLTQPTQPTTVTPPAGNPYAPVTPAPTTPVTNEPSGGGGAAGGFRVQ